MTDPRLNSVHLTVPRREDYRRAREVLLEARGFLTQHLEAQQVSSDIDSGDTLAENLKQAGAAPAKGRFLLMVRDRIYPLKIGLNTVGRLPDNDVVLEDPCVSRRHCAIVVHAHQGCEVHDTASKNGTIVNGRRITSPTGLKPGDEIQMCDLRIRFLNTDEVTSTPSQCQTGQS